jgi:hypothetical protein
LLGIAGVGIDADVLTADVRPFNRSGEA